MEQPFNIGDWVILESESNPEINGEYRIFFITENEREYMRMVNHRTQSRSGHCYAKEEKEYPLYSLWPPIPLYSRFGDIMLSEGGVVSGSSLRKKTSN